MFFISNAFADAGATQSNALTSFLPMIAFVAILYFLLIRPQQKRQKQHQALIAAIKKGDKVVTNSGIIATVSKVVNDHEVILEIANGVHCKFVKSAISSVVSDSVQTPNAPKAEQEKEETKDNKAAEKPQQSPHKTIHPKAKTATKAPAKKPAPKKTANRK